MPAEVTVSDELQRWLDSDEPRTLGSLVDMFGERAFALLFMVLLALPALPLPTGGATHVFEAVAMLLALELVAGRREVWLPERFKRREIAGSRRLIEGLTGRIRRLERFARPRGRRLFQGRLSGALFGLAVLLLSLAAFLAPPFSGLDTLPALGVVVLAFGYLVTDAVVAAAGFAIGAIGVVLIVGFGRVIAELVGGLF